MRKPSVYQVLSESQLKRLDQLGFKVVPKEDADPAAASGWIDAGIEFIGEETPGVVTTQTIDPRKPDKPGREPERKPDQGVAVWSEKEQAWINGVVHPTQIWNEEKQAWEDIPDAAPAPALSNPAGGGEQKPEPDKVTF